MSLVHCIPYSCTIYCKMLLSRGFVASSMQAATIINYLAESKHVIIESSYEASFYLEGGPAGSYRGAEYRAY